MRCAMQHAGVLGMSRLFLSVVVVSAIASLAAASDPTYDHQTTTYLAKYLPLTVTGAVPMAPFYSPEHSTDTLTSMIENAKSQMDIITPSAGSWLSECAAYVDDDATSCAPGCTPTEQRNETFPLFPALLNALHRGVSVRIVTNNYGLDDCAGTITMLQFLALNGAQVKYYTTTTYAHAKYQSADNGAVTSVSSINWSKTSMTKNREAGVLFDGTASDEAAAITAQMQAVFEHDFAQAIELVPGTWSEAYLAIITDPSEVPVVVPPVTFPEEDGLYVTPAPEFATDLTATTTVQASPDDAWNTITASLAQSDTEGGSLAVAMYQVTTTDLCDQLLALHQSGTNVSLLVSSRVYSATDCQAAQTCYSKLYEGGLKFRKSSNLYSYSHDKYWVINGKEVCWSTGNWSPSDYPTDHDEVYPPYGDPNWWKANRDFTVYTTAKPTVANFVDTFNGDWYAPETYPWTPEYDIICGY